MDLKDKTVLITGASSGIGAATARLAASRGATVLLVARRAGMLNDVAQSITAAGGKAMVFAADLATAAAVTKLAAQVRDSAGIPDVIVNNAGSGRWKALVDTSAEEARQMIELPYLAAFAMTREFLPAMIERGSGHIACVTSPASFMIWPNACAYIAARQALKGFTEALRAELRVTGIGVSLVALGVVDSPYWETNPGSRENLPPSIPYLMPVLSEEQAGTVVVQAIERNQRRAVKPAIFRLLFMLS